MKTAFWLGALAACGGSNASAITITSTITYVTPSGNVDRPEDLSHWTYQALVEDPPGTFARYPALPIAGDASGTVTIPDVPDAPIVIEERYGSEYTVLTALPDRELDRHETRIGRPDAAPVTAATMFGLQADQMAPWTADNSLEITSWGTGMLIEPFFDGLPIDGDTAMDLHIDWRSPLGDTQLGHAALMDPAAGDTLAVAHYTSEAGAAGTSITTITQYLELPAVAQADGSTTGASGHFATVAATKTGTLAIDTPAVAATFPADQHLATWGMFVVASPASRYGNISGLNPLAFHGGAVGGPQTSGAHAYGNPLDPTWPLLAYAVAEADVPVDLPGDPSIIATTLPSTRFATAPFSGTFTFPTEALFAADIALAGTVVDDHYITWDGASPLALTVKLPAGVTDFSAELYTLSKIGTATTIRSALRLHATGGRVLVPGEAFEPGGYYALRVLTATGDAVLSSGAWTATRIFRVGPATASLCGDGVIDTARGETCDGGTQCSATCQ